MALEPPGRGLPPQAAIHSTHPPRRGGKGRVGGRAPNLRIDLPAAGHLPRPPVAEGVRRFRDFDTENDLHPKWSNGILRGIFQLEIPILRHTDMPFGASLLCVARKPS